MRFAFQCRYIHLAAQRRDRKSNRQFTVKIVSFAMKDFVLLDVNDNVKIARWSAANTCLAIARGTQPRTLSNSSRNFQLNTAQFFHASLAMTLPAGFLDNFAGTATAGTGLRNLKERARTDHLTTTTAGGTGHGPRTWLSAAAMTFIADVELFDLNFLFNAESRFLERDLHVVTQIGTTPSIFGAAAGAPEKRFEDSAAESSTAENFAENVEWIVKAAAKTGTTLGKCGVTKTIVGDAFVRIHEHIVCFAEFFEFFLGVRVVWIFVWMKLDR